MLKENKKHNIMYPSETHPFSEITDCLNETFNWCEDRTLCAHLRQSDIQTTNFRTCSDQCFNKK